MKRDPRNKGIDWDAQPLGMVTDVVLARRLGVKPQTVCEARRRRDIKALVPRAGGAKFVSLELERFKAFAALIASGELSGTPALDRARELLVLELVEPPLPVLLCDADRCGEPALSTGLCAEHSSALGAFNDDALEGGLARM